MLQEQYFYQIINRSEQTNMSYDAYAYQSQPSVPVCISDDACDDFSTTLTPQAHVDIVDQIETEGYDESPFSLVEMLRHFPDLPLFISHPSFSQFSRLWLDFQKHIMMAKEPQYRTAVQAWLQSSILQAHYLMCSIVRSHSQADCDPEALPRSMFSAVRRLKDQMEIMHQALQIIENGRVWFDQSPLEAIAPLVETVVKIKQEINQFKLNPYALPVFQNNLIVRVPINEVSDQDLTQQAMDTFSLLSLESTCLDPVKQENRMVGGSSPAFYIPHHVNDAQFSHIEPSWIHFWSSAPVTPSVEQQSQHQPFISLPATPTWSEDQSLFIHPGLTGDSSNDLSLTSNVSEEDSHKQDIKKETSDEEYELEEEEEEDDDYDYNDDDEDYVAPEDDDDYGYRKRAKKVSNKGKSSSSSRSRRQSSGSKHTRRTATSYDAQTTHYLKSIFFDIYSIRDKLTKEQRKQVQKETGLKPRNITYWFSNHKRRFQNTLHVFKKTVQESNGKVKTYDDFLKWRRDRGLSEDILETE